MKKTDFRYFSLRSIISILVVPLMLVVKTVNGEDVNVMIDAAKVLNTGTARGARLGINIDYLWDDQANRVSGSPSLSAVLGQMKVKYLRYPDGEESDGHLWSTPPYTAPNPRLARISAQDWPSNQPNYWTPPGSLNGHWAHPVYDFDKFMSDCRAIQCEPVIVVAYDGIYKSAYPGGSSLSREQALEAAVAWVRYANIVKGYKVNYWEIGNESWLPSYVGGDPGRTQQAADLILFSRAMKEVDPTIKIGTSGDRQKDFDILLSVAGKDIDFLAVHYYPSQELRNYKVYQRRGLDPPRVINDAYKVLQKYVTYRDRIKIMMTETGGHTFGHHGNWTDCDLGHSLMTFETFAKLLQDKRVESSMFWNTRWDPGAPRENDALQPSINQYTAQGWALHILGNFVLEQMVSATATANMFAIASHDPATERMTVFFLNKNTDSIKVKVNLQNYTPPKIGSVWTLSGKGPSTLNPTFSQQDTVSVKDNEFSLKVRPVSITVVVLG